MGAEVVEIFFSFVPEVTNQPPTYLAMEQPE